MYTGAEIVPTVQCYESAWVILPVPAMRSRKKEAAPAPALNHRNIQREERFTLFHLFVTVIAGTLVTVVRTDVGSTVQQLTTLILTGKLLPTPGHRN